MKKIILAAIRFYQKYLDFGGAFKYLFLTDKACRFQPTCSQYCYQAIEKCGIMCGGLKCFRRVLRCHPFNEGGSDPVK